MEKYVECSMETKMEVRAALYSNIIIIDTYIEENPQKWKKFVQGDFHIERYLKRCAMFIENDTVYGVLGLHESFDEMIPQYRLPNVCAGSAVTV